MFLQEHVQAQRMQENALAHDLVEVETVFIIRDNFVFAFAHLLLQLQLTVLLCQ